MLVLIVFVAAVLGVLADSEERPLCDGRGVAKYNVTFTTFWSSEKFPKQYPTFRPHAQWSKLIGRTHSEHYHLWSEGDLADTGVTEFAEKGTSEILDLDTQGRRGILDVFNSPPINSGSGSNSVKALVDPYHSKLSVMVRLIPSPDWFVGVDSLELCREGRWLDKLTYALPPFDAGTDRGFTFTAPNWPELPVKPIDRITSKVPSHPANSFFYPKVSVLPTLAQVTLIKIATIEPDEPDEFAASDAAYRNRHSDRVYNHAETAPSRNRYPQKAIRESRTELSSLFRTAMKPVSFTPRPEVVVPSARLSRRKNRRGNKPARKQTAESNFPESCEVGEWQDWSACSVTCGYGTRIRTRLQLSAPQNGGRPCPVLREEGMCGSMRSCNWKHFNLGNWNNRKRKPRGRKAGPNRDSAASRQLGIAGAARPDRDGVRRQ